jgi:mono/diheme cytochrome c family protein/plastocyanin
VAFNWRRAWRRLALLLLVPAPALLIGLQEPSPLPRGVRVVDVVANVPEAGGFQPGSVSVRAGQKLRLRFRAADTTHGVAIGPGLGIDLGDLAPGEVKVVDVTFDAAGTFTFYCNRWCSPNHWRMRGVIEVQDRAQKQLLPVSDPVIARLADAGIDIDAYLADAHAAQPHSPLAISAAPLSAPEAAVGAIQVVGLNVPELLRDKEWRRTHTLLEGEALLLAVNPGAARARLRNVAAYLWLSPLDSTALDAAARLYAKNCAACHGERGDGDGFAAGSSPSPPPSFADAQRMTVRRSDVLYAKIRRGGMGTGMPNFGTLFSPEESWSLVDYLWLLALGE